MILGRTSRLLLLAAALGASGCRGGEDGDGAAPPFERPPVLSIAAASDLRYALDEVVEAFRRDHPDTGVSVTYGSSGGFFAQIVNGAPFDLYLAADVDYARQLADRGLADADSLFTYAEGRLVVWVPSASRLDVERLGLEMLVDPAVARIAIANPSHAPYGRAAEDALRSTGLYDDVKAKLVLGENVSQALQFVQSGAADAGLVALSLALAPPVAASGRYFLLPPDVHTPIEQGGVVLTGAARPDAAQAFRAFMLGEAARAVFARYGFASREH